MIKFNKVHDKDNTYDHTDISISTNTVNRDEVVDAFLSFLDACEFHTKDLREALGEFES
jgi:hypothetical protein